MWFIWYFFRRTVQSAATLSLMVIFCLIAGITYFWIDAFPEEWSGLTDATFRASLHLFAGLWALWMGTHSDVQKLMRLGFGRVSSLFSFWFLSLFLSASVVGGFYGLYFLIYRNFGQIDPPFGLALSAASAFFGLAVLTALGLMLSFVFKAEGRAYKAGILLWVLLLNLPETLPWSVGGEEYFKNFLSVIDMRSFAGRPSELVALEPVLFSSLYLSLFFLLVGTFCSVRRMARV